MALRERDLGRAQADSHGTHNLLGKSKEVRHHDAWLHFPGGLDPVSQVRRGTGRTAAITHFAAAAVTDALDQRYGDACRLESEHHV